MHACLQALHFIESMVCICPFAETERLQYVAVASTRGAVILISVAVLQDYNTQAPDEIIEIGMCLYIQWIQRSVVGHCSIIYRLALSEEQSDTLSSMKQMGVRILLTQECTHIHAHPVTIFSNLHVHPSLHTIKHKQKHTFFTPTCRHFLLYLLPHSHPEIHVHAHKDTQIESVLNPAVCQMAW